MIRKIKKTQKGMTLVEVLIAMALFSIMSLVVAMAFAAAMRTNLNNNNYNKAIDSKTANAEAQEGGTAAGVQPNYTFTFSDGTSVTLKSEISVLNDTNAPEFRFRYFKYSP